MSDSDKSSLLPKTGNNDSKRKLKARRTWKNVIVLTIAFTFNFIAYGAFLSVQSSLHREAGLGTNGLGVFFICLALSCLFLAPAMMKFYTHKWSMLSGMISEMFWICGNAIGTRTSIVITSVMQGIFFGGMFIAKNAYVAEMAKQHAEESLEGTADKIRTVFFGIITINVPLGYMLSNLLVYLIFRRNIKPDSWQNETALSQEDVKLFCGINDCPKVNVNVSSNFDAPPQSLVYTLLAVCLTIIACSIVLIILCLDPIKQEGNHPTSTTKNSILDSQELFSTFFSVIKILGNYKVWLLIPLTTAYAGVISFQIGTFTSSWVTCAYGVHTVGLVSIPGYLAATVTSFSMGYIANKFKRTPPMLCAMIMGLTSCIILYTWQVTNQNIAMPIIIIALMSVQCYTIEPILASVYGSSISDDTAAAYSCFSLTYAIMSSVFFSLSYYLCSYVKVLIIASNLLVGFACYFALEFYVMVKL